MNELEFLRSQVRLERTHMREVRASLRDALRRTLPPAQVDAFAQAAAAYLVFALRRFVAQDRGHCVRLAERVAAAPNVDAAERARIDAALGELASALQETEAATTALSAALEGRRRQALDLPAWLAACRRFDDFYEQHLVQRRHQLGAWLEHHYDIGDWRRTSLVDAESVFEERQLHEQFQHAQAALPAA